MKLEIQLCNERIKKLRCHKVGETKEEAEKRTDSIAEEEDILRDLVARKVEIEERNKQNLLFREVQRKVQVQKQLNCHVESDSNSSENEENFGDKRDEDSDTTSDERDSPIQQPRENEKQVEILQRMGSRVDCEEIDQILDFLIEMNDSEMKKASKELEDKKEEEGRKAKLIQGKIEQMEILGADNKAVVSENILTLQELKSFSQELQAKEKEKELNVPQSDKNDIEKNFESIDLIENLNHSTARVQEQQPLVIPKKTDKVLKIKKELIRNRTHTEVKGVVIYKLIISNLFDF